MEHTKKKQKSNTKTSPVWGHAYWSIPSPTKLFSFTFINFLNYKLTTPISMLVWSRNKTKNVQQCMAQKSSSRTAPVIIIMGCFWGKSLLPPLKINDFLMPTKYITLSNNLANSQFQQHSSVIR